MNYYLQTIITLSKDLKPHEYFSHLSALYLLEYLDFIPSTITITSNKRHRVRMINNLQIRYIFHKNITKDYIITKKIENTVITYSNLEKTLIDLLLDIDKSPDLDFIIKLFHTLPINSVKILDLAQNTSDTILKRVSFILATLGKIDESKVPYNKFKRTPILLDPRYKNSELRWYPKFHIKVPKKYFETFYFIVQTYKSTFINKSKSEIKRLLWLNLISSNSFRQYFENENFIPIYTKNFLSKFYEYYQKIFNNIDLLSLFSSLKYLHFNKDLINNINFLNHEKFIDYPVLFFKWLIKNKKIINSRLDEIKEFININLHTSSIDCIELALFTAYFSQIDSIIISQFPIHGYNLFNAGKFEIIELITSKFITKNIELSHHFYVLYARSLIRKDKHDKAIEIIMQAIKFFEQKPNHFIELGDLSYVLANTYTLLGKYSDAASELYIAREYYELANDKRKLATVNCSLGNVFFRIGEPQKAKDYYISAIKSLRKFNETSAIASILINLGIVEYQIGNFTKSIKYLIKAIKLHKKMKNNWNLSLAYLTIAKAYIKVGHLHHAISFLKKAHKLKNDLKHNSGIYESLLLLSWCYELLGQNDLKNIYSKIISNTNFDNNSIEPRVKFIAKALKAMSYLYNFDYTSAQKIYKEINDNIQSKEIATIEQVDCLHGIAFCQIMLNNNNAYYTLANALKLLGKKGKNFHQSVQIKFLAKLFFPQYFIKQNLSKIIKKLISSNYYDPFWLQILFKLYQTECLNNIKPFTTILKYKSLYCYFYYHAKKVPNLMFLNNLYLLDKKNASKEFFSQTFKLLKLNSKPKHYYIYSKNSIKKITSLCYQNIICSSKYQKILIFDFINNKILFQEIEIQLKPKTLTYKILYALLTCHPQPINEKILYESIWHANYSYEIDHTTVKHTIKRLSKILLPLQNVIQINKLSNLTTKCPDYSITVSCKWLLITEL